MAQGLKPIAEQVMVVTGVSSDVGFATAVAAAAGRAKLVLNAPSEDTLRDLVQEIRASGTEAAYVAGDAGERGVMERLAAMAIETFGRIDSWVNDVGVSSGARLGEASDEDNRRLFETNFWGVVYGSFAAIPELWKTEGVLINLGSEVSEAAVPLQGMYSASKHAVRGFTDALRVELLHDHIPVTVTLIEPGATYDPLDLAQAILEAASSAVTERTAKKPMGRQRQEESPRSPGGAHHPPSMTGGAHRRGGRVKRG